MAQVLGREDDAKKYAELAAQIREAFNRAYVNDEGVIAGDTQAGYAIALYFGLLPEDKQAIAAERMVERFKRYDGQISTGFHSTRCLMEELTRRGYNDEAYRLINNRKMPSWGYAIEHGATTIWERWDGYVEGRGFQNPGMNSFAHYALGSVGEWMMRTIIGIHPDPEVPAWKRSIIRPMPGGDLAWARGSYDSIHGRIAVEWRLSGSSIDVSVSVPANTSAVLHLPSTDPSAATEGGLALSDSVGINVVRTADDEIVCELEAGEYRLRAPWRE
jgi:alpha-L-rhamnosidase